MENQTPIMPMANSPQTTEVQSSTVDSKPSTSNFLVILLSILLFISLTIAGFFAYQTQKLTKELVILNNEQAFIPSPTSDQIFPPELTAEQDAMLDPTANWKTYINNDENFIIKYPNSWSEPTKSLQSTRATYVFTPPNNLNIVVGFNYDQALNRSRTYDEELAEEEKYAISKRDLVISSGKITIYAKGVDKIISEETAIFKGENGNIIWITMNHIPEIDPVIFNQILSTFKFTN